MPDDTLDQIRERDAALHYCATCGNRFYEDEEDNPHNFTVEECDRRLAGKREKIDGHYCWEPQAHHPFVEGEIPDYYPAQRDRRALLRILDRA